MADQASKQSDAGQNLILQRDLIRAKDQIDDELMRFEAIQAYIAAALGAETEEEFSVLTLEAIIEAFEFEVAAFLVPGEQEDRLKVLGEFGFGEAPESVAYQPDWFGAGDCIIARAGEPILDVWPALNLDQAIICSFGNKDGEFAGAILGGVTKDNSGIYEPISADLHSAYSVIVQQAGALWNTRQLNSEIHRQNERLEAEIGRFLITQKELIGTKDRVDEELMRFRTLQAYIVGALNAETEEDFFGLTLEAVIEAFEFEVALFVKPSKDNDGLIVAGEFGFEEPPERLAFSPEWITTSDARVLPPGDALLENWPELGLDQAIFCPFQDRNEEFAGFILGGITKESTDIFDPISDEQASAFSVLVRQAGALWVNRQLNDEIRAHNAQLVALTDSYSRFVPFEFLELLNKDTIQDIHAGDNASLEMSVLVLDIRGFTALTERLGPADTFSWLNEFLQVMEPRIAAEKGFINQYQGDAIMALFPGAADSALRCAADIMAAARSFNQGQEKKGQMTVNFGLGINSGPLMVGAIGGEGRLDSNVVGDAANLAARTEGLTKHYGVAAIFTEFSHSGLAAPDQFRFRELDTAKVKGREGAVTIFELMANHIDAAALQCYADGLGHYRAGAFAAALGAFTACLEKTPGDGAARLFLERCERYLADPPGALWDGISVIDEK
ncbi:MAG: adenylate/guanylate cyclase domain-containing protein [Rhodospirillales bacterium]|nr:adenylate/guanylate cyclase domain-containing protein [Rhodospirillales bacterium]